MDPNEIRKRLKDTLSPKRYSHTLSVAGTAVWIAARIGADKSKMELAALLHDAAKRMKPHELMEFCDRELLFTCPDDRLVPGVLHALAGARLAASEFGVTDLEVIDAVRWHTTGRANMTLLARGLFAADYLEPGRGLSTRLLLDAVENDFNGVFLEIVRQKIIFVLQKNARIHPASLECYHSLLQENASLLGTFV